MIRRALSSPAFRVGLISLCGALIIAHGAFTLPGILSYVDFNVPVSWHALVVSIERYLGSWDWFSNAGRPNPSFLAEDVLLWLYAAVAALLGVALGSKVLLVVMLWITILGVFFTLRYAGASKTSAGAAATLFVANPWFYDEIAQGHVYLLLSAAIVPFVLASFTGDRRWTTLQWSLVSVLLFLLVGIDFRFAALAFACAGLGLVFTAFSVGWRETAWRAASLFVSVLLLSGILFSYAAMLHALAQGNTPPAASLDFYSSFLSLVSSLTLVRNNYNSSAALGSVGIYNALWWPAMFALVFLGIRALWQQGTARSRLLIAVWVAGMILGLGSEPPLGFLNVALYEHVKIIADLFRDPSKFYILALSGMTFAVAVMIDGWRVPWPNLGSYSFSAQITVERAFQSVGDYIKRMRLGNVYSAAMIAIVVIVAIPFVAVTPSTFATFDPVAQRPSLDTLSAAQAAAKGTRFALYPFGVRASYGGDYLYDPLVLFPESFNARIPVAYDFDSSALTARWALSGLLTGYDPAPLGSLSDLGVGAVGIRDNVHGDFDLPDERALLGSDNAETNLRSTTGLNWDENVASLPNAALAVGAKALLSVDEGDRAIVSVARELSIVPDASIWCAKDSCPRSAPEFSIQALDAPGGGCDFNLNSLQSANGKSGTVSWQHWLSAGGVPVRFNTPPLVADSLDGALAVPACGRGHRDVWLRIISSNSETRSDLLVSDGMQSRKIAFPQRLDASLSWIYAGRFNLNRSLRIKIQNSPSVIETIRAVPFVVEKAPDIAVSSAGSAIKYGGEVQVRSHPGAYAATEVVLRGARRAASAVYQVSFPPGRYFATLRGRVWPKGTVVTFESGNSCRVPVATDYSAQFCQLSLAPSERITVHVAGGTLTTDALGFSRLSPPLYRKPLLAHALEFTHGLNDYSVRTTEPETALAVKVAMPSFWSGNRAPDGVAYDYAALFTRVDRGGLKMTFRPSADLLLITLVSSAFAILIWFAHWLLESRNRTPGEDRANTEKLKQPNCALQE